MTPLAAACYYASRCISRISKAFSFFFWALRRFFSVWLIGAVLTLAAPGKSSRSLQICSGALLLPAVRGGCCTRPRGSK